VSGVLPVELGGTGISDVPAIGEILVGNGSGYTLTQFPNVYKEIYENLNFGWNGPYLSGGRPGTIKATKNLIDNTVTIAVGSIFYPISGTTNNTNINSLNGIPSDFAPPVDTFFPIVVDLGIAGPALGIVEFSLTGQITIYSNQDLTSNWAGVSGVTDVGTTGGSFTWQL
jgi:hypothetical protein